MCGTLALIVEKIEVRFGAVAKALPSGGGARSRLPDLNEQQHE
jgi:hypothetical protein